MSDTLPQSADCCLDCADPVVTAIPGPQGDPCDPCDDGADGLNAYSLIDATVPVAVPAFSGSATVKLQDPPGSRWMAVGQIVYVSPYGYFQVTATPTPTTATLLNLGDGTSYLGNFDNTVNFANGSKVSPAGMQGIQGALPADVMLKSQNLAGLLTIATARTNLGLGTAAVVDTGIANTKIPTVNMVAGLTNGDSVFSTASGLETKTAANARTALGLGTMAVQNANAVAITGGTLNGSLGGATPAAAAVTSFNASGAATFNGAVTFTSKVFTTPSALQTLAAANVITSTASKIRIVGNAGPVVMTSTPTIAVGTADGQLLLVLGTHDTNTVEVQDNGSLAGSQLRLGAANRTLGKGDSLLLSWDAADAMWYEVAFTALV